MIRTWSQTVKSYLSGQRRAGLVSALIAFMGLFLLWSLVGTQIELHFNNEEREQVGFQVGRLGSSLALGVNQRMSLVTSLQAYVEAEAANHDLFDGYEMDAFSAGLYNSAAGIRNIALAPQGVMKFVYPYEANKSVLGYEPAQDPRQHVRDEVQRAITSGKVILSLPNELVQGGLGLIARQAIVVQGAYWGLANIVVDVDPLLAEAGVDPLPAGLDLALKDQSGQVFYGDPQVFSSDPVSYVIQLPEGSWELAGIPTKGWESEYQGIFWLYRILGLLVVFTLPITLYLSIHRRERIVLLVEERTKELSTVNQQLEQQISERRRVEEALHLSEERHRNIAGITSDYAYELQVDEKGLLRFEWVTDGFQRITGSTLDAHEFRGDWASLVFPEDISLARQRAARLLSGQADVCEYRIITKNGDVRWLRDYGQPEWNEALGRVVRIYGAAQDVTGRVIAEKALVESEEKLRFIFEHAFDGISIYEEIPSSRSRRLIDCNERYAKMAGRSKEELLATSNTSLLQKRVEPSRSDEENLKIRQNKTPYWGTFSWIRPDGEENVMEYTAAPIEMGNRSITIGIDRDITARIRSEQALEAAAREWQSTFDSVTVAICLLDSESRIIRTNQAMEAMFPTQRGRMKGRYSWEVVHGSQKPIPEDPVRVMAQTLQRETLELPFGDRIIEVTVDPILGPDGTLSGAVHIIRDITLRKEAEEALRNYSESLEERVAQRTRELQDAQERLIRQEKLAVLGQLAGGVGHELRNPLGVMTNAVYFLKMLLPESDGEESEYLEIIENQVHNATRIVTDLLDFAAARPGDRERVQVLDLMVRVLVQFPVPENVTLDLCIPDDQPPVFVDPHQIIQVLGNLVTNAYQAMPAGGVLTLQTKLQGDDHNPSWVSVHITDSGSGIPEENLGKLFEPLFTTKPKGIGLGLAISKKLVEANEGKIEVESEGFAGKGSTFKVWLPLGNVLADCG